MGNNVIPQHSLQQQSLFDEASVEAPASQREEPEPNERCTVNRAALAMAKELALGKIWSALTGRLYTGRYEQPWNDPVVEKEHSRLVREFRERVGETKSVARIYEAADEVIHQAAIGSLQFTPVRGRPRLPR